MELVNDKLLEMHLKGLFIDEHIKSTRDESSLLCGVCKDFFKCFFSLFTTLLFTLLG